MCQAQETADPGEAAGVALASGTALDLAGVSRARDAGASKVSWSFSFSTHHVIALSRRL